MKPFSEILNTIDRFVWGPFMLILLIGTGIFLTIRTKFLPWRNLGYALRSTLSTEARTTNHEIGNVSPFSALMTTLASTIGTGNIVGVATAMIAGGPGALVWMWISACFGLSSKFSECMLAVKYREKNSRGEIIGGPMYTMKNSFRNKKLGATLGWFFAFFAVIASFGIGNLTQANSIASALKSTFGIPNQIIGILITILALFIIIGGIETISKVSSVVVPLMAVFYIIAGLLVIAFHYRNIPEGIILIVKSAFCMESISGGILGTIIASYSNAMRYGIARGIFSNEAGMGSAAISAAVAANHPVRQGYISMTGTFWDTIVICSITGLCIACSGVLGTTRVTQDNVYSYEGNILMITSAGETGTTVTTGYRMDFKDGIVTLTSSDNRDIYRLSRCLQEETAAKTDLANHPFSKGRLENNRILGTWIDQNQNVFKFNPDGTYSYEELYTGSALTLQAFTSTFGETGGWFLTIGITFFAFSTILGWEYHGEKAFEYLLHTHKFNIVYRIIFSLISYLGATTALDLVWNLSNIANALMAIPNLICLLLLNKEIATDIEAFQSILKQECTKRNASASAAKVK